MASRQKISQMTPKGANLEATDLLEISELSGSGYITKSITGAELVGDYVPYTGATTDVDLGEFGLDTGFITFDTTPTETPTTQGTLSWDVDDETLQLVMNGSIMKVGEDQYYPVKNQTGTTIAKGTAVQFAGTLGSSGRLLIAPYLADGSVSSSIFMGVTSEQILNGEDGKVMWFGRIRGIDTNAYNEGDILYASPTVAGGLTTVANNQVQVAAVINKSTTNGVVFVRPSIYPSISGLLGYTPAPQQITLSKKSASYVLVLSDNYKLIEMEVGTANTLTIPTNTAQPFPTGTQILVSQLGTGQTTITPDTGVTLRSSGGKTKTSAQYAMATLIKRTANEWYLAGDITT
jgi:hypothetical protein